MQQLVLFRGQLLRIAAIILGLCAAPDAQAQGPGRMGTPAERTEQRIALLTTQLQLTPQQVEQIRPLLSKQFTDQVAMMQKMQAGGDREAIRAETMTLRQKTDEQIQGLLTDAQKPLYRKLLEEERARRAAGMGGGLRQ